MINSRNLIYTNILDLTPLLDRPTGRLLFPIAAVLLALLADLASVVAFLCCQERFYCSWLIFNFPV